jgi:ABC-type branched-subunit amino acid transport system substrate-binding protein
MARHPRLTRTIVAAATVFATVAVASAVPAAAADSTGQVKGKPIILMQIHEKTAGLATKDLSDGVRAGIKQVNDAGGVNGRPLRYLECDTKDDPNTAADCARTAADKGAAAVVGSITVHPEYYPILEQNKIASFGNIPANAGDFTSPASFPIIGGAPIAFPLLGLGLAKDGAQKISVARPDLAAGAVIKSFVNQGLTTKGLSVVNDVPVPQGAPDMSAYVQAALANGTDAVLVALSGQDALNFVQALKQADPKVKVAMASTDFGSTVKALGKQSDGIYSFSYSYLPVIKNAATKKFVAAAKAAKIPTSGLNTVDEYAAVLAFAAIAKQLPDVSASAFYDKLPTVDNLNIGMTAPIQFVKGGTAGLPRDFNPCALLYTLKNGAPTPTTGKFLNPLTDQECTA